MTSILAKATAYAYAPLSFDTENALFASGEDDAASAPLFCSRAIISSAAPYIATHGRLTTNMLELFVRIPSFRQFAPRVSAVPGRFSPRAIELLQRMPNLRELEVVDCINDYATAKLLACHRRLQYLSLASCNVTDLTVSVIVQLKSLTRLDLSDNSLLRAGGIKDLAEELTQLTHLNLSGVDPEDALAACRSLGASAAPLRLLDLSGWSRLSDECISVLPPALAVLRLANMAPRTSHVMWGRQANARTGTLTGDGLLRAITSRFESLVHLNLANCPASNLRLETFRALSPMPWLREVVVRGIPVGGAHALLELTAEMPHVRFVL